jgi:hypothetical protein
VGVWDGLVVVGGGDVGILVGDFGGHCSRWRADEKGGGQRLWWEVTD